MAYIVGIAYGHFDRYGEERVGAVTYQLGSIRRRKLGCYIAPNRSRKAC
jgi:hypothetical protein